MAQIRPFYALTPSPDNAAANIGTIIFKIISLVVI